MNEFMKNTILPILVVLGVLASCVVSVCFYSCVKYLTEIARIRRYEKLALSEDEDARTSEHQQTEESPSRKSSIKANDTYGRSLAMLQMIPEVNENIETDNLRDKLRLRDFITNTVYNYDKGYLQVRVHRMLFCPFPEDFSQEFSIQYVLSFSFKDAEFFESEIRPLRESVRFDETYRMYINVAESDGADVVCKVHLLDKQLKRTQLWQIKYTLKPEVALSLSDPGTISEDPEVLSTMEKVSKVYLVREITEYQEWPKLLIGLCYKPTSGRILVRVIEGRNFPVTSHQMRVRVALVQTKYGSVRSFTSPVMENASNPVINETFSLGIAIKNIQSIVLIVLLMYGYHGKTFSPIAETKIGNLVSKEDGRMHWSEMLASIREEKQAWHTLC